MDNLNIINLCLDKGVHYIFIAVDRELRVTKATDKKVVEGQLELF